MKKRFYIAYGSNLNLPQMRMRCPGATIVGTANLDGYELLFKGSRTGSYLTIEPKEGSTVPVAVWATSEANEKALDRYEGFPTFYYKKEMEMAVKDMLTNEVRKLNAYVYIMHEDRPFGLPSFHYVDTCLEGYQSFGFNEDFLFEAMEETKRRMRHEKRF